MPNSGIISIWLLFILINIMLAWQNDMVRRKRIAENNPKQIEHFLYFLGYCALIGVIYWKVHSWVEVVSLLLLHASVFPVSYNLCAGLPPFSLSKTSKAIFDRLQVKVGLKSSEEVNVIAFCVSIILFFYQLF